MNNYRAYIKSGFGNTTVTGEKPFCWPLLNSLRVIDLRLVIEINGGIELGLITRDHFFVSLEAEIQLIHKFDEVQILNNFSEGNFTEEILKSRALETVRSFIKDIDFEEFESKKDLLSQQLLSDLSSQCIEEVKFNFVALNRVPLDDYDLDNIIQFEAAKDIVTRIAQCRFKEKEFIDQCRKTIAHFDIVDE